MEVNLLQLGPRVLAIRIKCFKGVSKLGAEVADDFVVPRIVLGVDPIEHKSIVDDDRAKVYFSLTVIESLPVLPDLVEQILPERDIISQLLIDLFGVNHPQRFVVEPLFYVLLCVVEN